MNDFIHHFEQGDVTKPSLLLLHGTGGDENDLVPLAHQVAPNATLLSPRGKILENGMPRFFKRFDDGSFDQVDLVARTHELADFIIAACVRYNIDPKHLYAFGYSNGANITSSLLMLRPEVIAGGVLMRAMMTVQPDPLPDLQDKKVLILSGMMDPIIPAVQTKALAELLEQSGADVLFKPRVTGHGLERQDVIEAKQWYDAL